MLTRYKLLIAVVIGICWQSGSPAEAQMFGERTLGSTLSPQSGPSDFNSVSLFDNLGDVGTLSGNERYLRGNRSIRDFVGADMRDLSGFVGIQSGRLQGPIRSAVEGLRSTTEAGINRPLRVPSNANRPYDPRLQIGFDYRPTSDTVAVAQDITTKVLERLGDRVNDSVQIQMDGRTAILQGEVNSAGQQRLIEELVRLEPGVSQVENRLRIAGSDDALGRPATPESDTSSRRREQF